MAEDPKKFLKSLGERNSRAAIDALKQYPNKTCVFCAAPGLDCNPLYRFPKTDLFVYADAGSDFDSLWKMPPRPIERTPVGEGLGFAGCYCLGANAPNALVREPIVGELLRLGAGETPEVRLIMLQRTIGGERRTFWLLWVGLDAHRVYEAMFSARDLAPKCLCLFPAPENENSWDGPLAGLVKTNAAAKPEFIVSDDSCYDWPWAQTWQSFNGWPGMVMYALRDRTLNNLLPDSQVGIRTVVVKNAALTPETIGDAKAACISVASHEEFQWPGHVRLFVDAPEGYEPDTDTARLNPNFDTLALWGLPLRKALARLQRRCWGVDNLATTRLGFEDEGPELAQWRRTPGTPNRLTIHCELPGDVEAIGPYADEIH